MDKAEKLAYVWPDGEYYLIDELWDVEPEQAMGYTKSDDYYTLYSDDDLNTFRHLFNSDNEFNDFVADMYGLLWT